ncbi:extracellular solute-binding protein [Halarsenatibacter silvermanii]|uniref:Extracellular solute-binding protein n=2 Tax=Halarsenatibacter silvermanii TaxID=321763 RepID=A0A1G9THU5_9FIRM|nr:extracellular solute-binding protein [Halarsenatibacter silvermanii]
MLNELGYDEAPDTWDEMLDISHEAIDEGLAEYGFFPGYLAGHEDGMVQFDLMLKLHDGQWMNEDKTEWTFNDEAGVEALTQMKEHLDEGLIPEASLEQSDWDNMHLFLSGETPFEINWNFVHQMAIDPEQSEIIDDFSVGHVPGIEGKERDTYTVLGGGGYAISPTTRSEEWSFKLLDYMHRTDGAVGVMEEQGGAEATMIDTYENPEEYGFSPDEYEMIDVFRQQLEYGGVRPSDYLTWYSEFRDNIFTPAMHRALLGEQEIEEALDQAQEEAQQMLEAEGL